MLSPSATRQNAYEQAKAKLIERLQFLVVPNPIRLFPGPSDFLEAARVLRETAEIYDDFVRAVGCEVENNTSYRFDSRAFDAVASGAVTDAIFECENISERLQDDREAA